MEVQTEVHISQSLTHFTILYITKVTNFGMWRKGVDRIDQLYILELLLKKKTLSEKFSLQFPWYFRPLLVPQRKRDSGLLPKGDGCLHHPRQVLHQRPGYPPQKIRRSNS